MGPRPGGSISSAYGGAGGAGGARLSGGLGGARLPAGGYNPGFGYRPMGCGAAIDVSPTQPLALTVARTMPRTPSLHRELCRNAGLDPLTGLAPGPWLPPNHSLNPRLARYNPGLDIFTGMAIGNMLRTPHHHHSSHHIHRGHIDGGGGANSSSSSSAADGGGGMPRGRISPSTLCTLTSRLTPHA